MRFILGLIIGALTTFLVASALGISDNTQIKAPLQKVLQQADASWQQLSASEPSPEDSFVTKASADPPANELPLAEAEPAAKVALEQEQELQPELEQEPETETNDVAVVWSPFHSEASASGFANRLTRQLEHPFNVRKQGPANYLVTYTYADEAHHAQLQRQIAKITGAPSS